MGKEPVSRRSEPPLWSEHFSFHSPIRRYLEPTIAFPDARPLCCCESRWQQRTFAFNSFHLTMEGRVQHPTLNDRSATHVFVAAIGTTAFLRSTAVRFGPKSGLMQRSKNDRYSITLVGAGEQCGQTMTGKRVQVIGVPSVAEVDHHERGYSANDHVQ